MPRRKNRNTRRPVAATDSPDKPQTRLRFGLLVGAAVSAIALLCVTFVFRPLQPPADDSQGPPPASRASALPYKIPARPELPTADDEAQEEASIAAHRNQSFDVAESVVKALPASADAVSLLATVHHRHSNERAANALWHACLKLDPQCADALHMLGTTALARDDLEEAESHLQQALRIDPEWTAIPLPLAKALSRQGKFREAAEVLEQYQRKVPDDVQAGCLLGRAYHQLREFEKAQACFQTALKVAPDYADACYSLSITLRALGKDAEATACAEQFAAMNQGNEQAVRQRRSDLDDTWRMRTTLVNTHMSAARVYLRHRMPDAAVPHLQSAATLEPEHRESRELLCNIYVAQQDAAAALQIRQELCRIDPDDPRQWLRAGILSYQVGDTTEAERAFRRLIELAPDQAEGYLTLAQILMPRNKNPLEAIKLAQQGIELAATAPNYHILGAVYENAGDIQSARRALAQAVRLDPGNRKYQDAYRRLQHEQCP